MPTSSAPRNSLAHAAEADEETRRKMRAVRQSGTSPEIAVRGALDSLEIQFLTNVAGEPGRPNIWITEHDIPIFVHGCFRHRHEGCKKTTTPKKNRKFWLAKFEKNKERDARNVRQLMDAGYAPITVWQCETTTNSRLKEILAERIQGTKS